jgi:hypothetical protein
VPPSPTPVVDAIADAIADTGALPRRQDAPAAQLSPSPRPPPARITAQRAYCHDARAQFGGQK